MKKNALVAGAIACALLCPLAACGGSSSTSSTTTDSSSSAAASSSDFDAVGTYYGQWHGYVETTGESVYGTAGGVEPMLDVELAEDGTCTVEPTEAHSDLFTAEGTWEAVEGTITMHFDDRDIEMTVDGETATADPTLFDIDGFDVISFDFYG